MDIVLGIDPSLNSTGWAIVAGEKNKYSLVACGSVVFASGGDAIEKIKNISMAVQGLIKQHSIGIVAIEETFVNKNAATSLKLGMVRGGCVAAAAMLDAKVFEYSPREVKLAITGTGSADKDQLLFMLQHILGKQPVLNNKDESDAICIALTHLFRTHSKLG